MAATMTDPGLKTMDEAKRQFVELYGSALVMNTYLKIALVLVSLVEVDVVVVSEDEVVVVVSGSPVVMGSLVASSVVPVGSSSVALPVALPVVPGLSLVVVVASSSSPQAAVASRARSSVVARRGEVWRGMRMLVTPAMGGEKCFVRMAPCAGCMANGVLGRGRA